MKVGRFRHVVVVEDNGDEVAGVISQRDIFYGALAWSVGLGSDAYEKTLDSQSVKAVMQTDVTTIDPGAPMVEAAQILLEKRIGCLPVVENGLLVGILTEGDFLSLLTDTAVERA
jgi:CBS domain-containing protein